MIDAADSASTATSRPPAALRPTPESRPLVTVVAPAYNEAAILARNVDTLCDYLDTLADRYRWELLIVNDGSTDDTARLADEAAARRPGVRVVHHPVNMNLGQALRTGFAHARGEYVVVMDLDLSYAPDHIARMLDTLVATKSHIVVASPYMKGGQNTAVPFLRLQLSKWANRFLAYFSRHGGLRTLTGMVRAYDRRFLRRLNLKAMGVEINTEILYKAMMLRGRVVEVPAHLDWTLQVKEGKGRVSSFRILKGILTYLISGFIFRPFMFFLIPGFAALAVSLYVVGWTFVNVAEAYPMAPGGSFFDDKFSEAVRMVFNARPHAFFVGGITLIFALQLLSLGFLSLQNKKYFEELFHLGSPGEDPEG